MIRAMVHLLLIAVALVATTSAKPANIEEDGLFKINPEAYNILEGGDTARDLPLCRETERPRNPGRGNGGSGEVKIKYVMDKVGRCCKTRLHQTGEGQRWYIVIQRIENIELDPEEKELRAGEILVYDWESIEENPNQLPEIKLATEENLDPQDMPMFITKSETNSVQVKICGHSDDVDKLARVDYSMNAYDPNEQGA